MGKLRNTVLVLGEGPTEFYYFNSLRDVYKGMAIKPDYPKHTTIRDLEAKIAEGVELGFNHIFCIIDMDTKDREPECSQYARLKKKYARPISKPKKGLYCEVKFSRPIVARNYSSCTTSVTPLVLIPNRTLCSET